jgi:hypothetical protein
VIRQNLNKFKDMVQSNDRKRYFDNVPDVVSAPNVDDYISKVGHTLDDLAIAAFTVLSFK